MICPNCKTTIFDNARFGTGRVRESEDGSITAHESIRTQDCPECDQYIVEYQLSTSEHPEPDLEEIIWPIARAEARPVPSEVPDKFAEDYKEACLVLDDSPKASAALSRRCLQLIIRDELGVKEGNLYSEIQEIIGRPGVPSYVSETLDHVRKIGNFAAHANKNSATGEIVPVEQSEAEWCLELIEELYDFCFVAPACAKRRQQAIDAKFRG